MTHASFSHSRFPARHMQFIATLSYLLKLSVSCVLSLFIGILVFSSIASAQTINFESPTYTVGSINGQDGWSAAGSVGTRGTGPTRRKRPG